MNTVSKYFNKFLAFMNLSDSAGNLSITNVAVIIMVTKLAFLPTFTLAEVSAFLIVMLNYGHKRRENAKATVNKVNVTDAVAEKIKEIESKVSGLVMGQTLRRK